MSKSIMPSDKERRHRARCLLQIESYLDSAIDDSDAEYLGHLDSLSGIRDVLNGAGEYLTKAEYERFKGLVTKIQQDNLGYLQHCRLMLKIRRQRQMAEQQLKVQQYRLKGLD